MTAATAAMAAATALQVAIAGGRSNAGSRCRPQIPQMLTANPTSGGVHPQPEERSVGTSIRAPTKRYWKSGRGRTKGCIKWCTVICVIG